MTALDPFVTAARTLPVVPRPISGESFHSWAVRTSAASRISLDLILEQMGIYEPTTRGAVPIGYGIALDPRTLARVAAVTDVEPEVIEQLLLVPTYSALFDTSILDQHTPDSFRRFGLREWVYLVGSKLCPRCLVERGGAWRLSWRLPWTFACAQHRVLLLDTCPACEWVIGGGRRDYRTGPSFLSWIHTPTRCMNRRPYGLSPAGRAAEPCGQDLTELTAAALGKGSLVLEAQRRIDAMLDEGRCPEPWGNDVRSYFGDLRALVALLLIVPDPALVHRLAGGDLPAPCEAALVAQAHRQELAGTERDRRVATGRTWRGGPRIRTWLKAPRDTALIAALATAAVNVLRRGDLDDLRAIHDIDVTLLGSKLAEFHPSPHLVGFTEQILRQRNFSRSLGMHSRRGMRTRPHRLEARHIPELCWEPAWHAYFETPCRRARIMERTGRRFVSLCLMKRVTGASWREAGVTLGMRSSTATDMAHRCVQQLSRVGSVQEFGDALLALSRYLDADAVPLIDYGWRRAHFETLDTLPASRQVVAAPLSENARRYYAPAWLWALLTGGAAVNAPSMQRCPITAKVDMYGLFRRQQLPRSLGALTSAAATLCPLAPYETQAPTLDIVVGEAFGVDQPRFVWPSTPGSGDQRQSGQPEAASPPDIEGTAARWRQQDADRRRTAMKGLLDAGMSTAQVGRRFGVSAQRVHQIVGSRAVPTLSERRSLAFNAEHGQEVERLFYRLRDDAAVADRLGLAKKDVRRCVDQIVPDPWVLRRFPLTVRDPYTDGEVLRCLAEASDDLGGRLTELKYNEWARRRHLPDGRPTPLHRIAVTRFGGWHSAVHRSRATAAHPRGERFRSAIADVSRAWQELGRPPSTREYEDWRRRQLGAPSATSVRRAAGGWNELLVSAWSSVHDQSVLSRKVQALHRDGHEPGRYR